MKWPAWIAASPDLTWLVCSVNGARTGPAYAALARAVRLLVLDGRLPLRTRLPGERELADALGVSRTTATAAYAALREEGFLASRRGAGSWTQLPADAGVASAPGPGRRWRDRPELCRDGRARGRAARRARDRHRRAPAPPAGPRLRRRRPAGPACGDRRTPDRPRRADHARAGTGHRGRAARAHAAPARALRPRRPRAGRAPELSGGARRRSARSAPGRSRCRCSRTAGTSRCWRRRCARPRPGSRT